MKVIFIKVRTTVFRGTPTTCQSENGERVSEPQREREERHKLREGVDCVKKKDKTIDKSRRG